MFCTLIGFYQAHGVDHRESKTSVKAVSAWQIMCPPVTRIRPEGNMTLAWPERRAVMGGVSGRLGALGRGVCVAACGGVSAAAVGDGTTGVAPRQAAIRALPAAPAVARTIGGGLATGTGARPYAGAVHREHP